MTSIRGIARDERTNAALGWLLAGVVAAAAVESVLTGGFLWGGFALLVAVVAAVPAAVCGRWTAMVPWPLLGVAAVAVLVRAAGFAPELAGYLAVAALALIAVVELDAFTSVAMSRRFAVGFAALTTLAVQGLWTVAQYYSDLWLGTEFLRSQRELQVDIVAVTVVGVATAAVFEWYFERVDHVGSPDDRIAADRR